MNPELSNPSYFDPNQNSNSNNSSAIVPSFLSINTLTVGNSYDHIPLESEHNQRNSIKKHRSWTREEHNWFLFGLITIRSGDWRRIARIVRSRTPTQVASHAQKYHFRQDETNKNTFSTKRKRRTSIHDRNVNDLCNERFPPLINLIENVLSVKYQTPVSIQQWPPVQIQSVVEQLPQLLEQFSLQNLPELLRNQTFVDSSHQPPALDQNFDNPTCQYLLSGYQKFDAPFPQHQPRLQLLEWPTQHPSNNEAQHEPELQPIHSPNSNNQVQHQLPIQELELPEMQSLPEEVRRALYF